VPMQIEYYDGQFDDARYALALAQTAALHGAAALNYARVEGLLRAAASDSSTPGSASGPSGHAARHVIGATICDLETGKKCDVHARVVVNAAGPFTDDVRRMSQGEATADIVRPSAGAAPMLGAQGLDAIVPSQ
jgi:glycerol-3-phosphate dehydrogenase